MTVTGGVCAVVAGLALAYCVDEARRLRSGRSLRYVGRAQGARRVAGSFLVAVLMVLVDLGLEEIDPHESVNTFVYVWLAAFLLTVLLLLLAFVDLRELELNRERERIRELERFRRELGGATTLGPRDGEGD